MTKDLGFSIESFDDIRKDAFLEWYQNFHQTNVYALETNAIYNTKNGSNVIGMEIRTDQILSNVLGEDLENPISVNNSDGLYLKGKSETITNLFGYKYKYIKRTNDYAHWSTSLNTPAVERQCLASAYGLDLCHYRNRV